MLNLYDFFANPKPEDKAKASASAGWMDLMHQKGMLQGGSDIRNSFIEGNQLQKEYLGNVLRTFPRQSFSQNNIDELGLEFSNFICGDRDLRVRNAFNDSILEIMRNCIEHSGKAGGTLSGVRTSYYASVMIRDEGIGFLGNYKGILEQAGEHNCPTDQYDALAVDLGVIPRLTTNRKLLSDNAGTGLPRFLAAAEQAIVVSGRARYIERRDNPDTAIGVLKKIPSIGKAIMSDEDYQGVAIEGYFSLKRVDTRVAGYREPDDGEIVQRIDTLLGGGGAVLLRREQ